MAEARANVGLVMRLLRLSARFYTLYRLDALLSITMSGYQWQNAAAWLLLTQLVIYHALVYDTIKVIVRTPQRVFRSIA